MITTQDIRGYRKFTKLSIKYQHTQIRIYSQHTMRCFQFWNTTKKDYYPSATKIQTSSYCTIVKGSLLARYQVFDSTNYFEQSGRGPPYFLPLIRLPLTFMVLPPTFSLRLPVRFILPCDLQLLTQLAGRLDIGFEHTPLGAGPMFSSVLYISCIFIACVFNTSYMSS